MKSKERTDQTAEFFTPTYLVDELIDAVDIGDDSTYSVLDPACGNGQFIMGILNKKVNSYLTKNNLNKKKIPPQKLLELKSDALKETYGVDLMASNIADLIARIVFWKMWDIEIFDEHGIPKDKLINIQYDDCDDAYWLKERIENGEEYKRIYEYDNMRVSVRTRTERWWLMEYSILGGDNKDYTGGGFCKNFVVADGLKYDYEFNREPVLETHSEQYIRLVLEMKENSGKSNEALVDID